jgi:uncharacterized protein YjbI with pentapeptide repeats
MSDFTSWWDQYGELVINGFFLLALGFILGTWYYRRRQQKLWATGKQPRPFRPLTWWMIAIPIAVGIALTTGAIIVLLNVAGEATSATDQAQLTIEAIRTGLAVGIGAGGVAVLLLNSRRQWVNEREHMLQTEIARDTQYDAGEKRVTELYTRAVDQLANESAAVRVGALYSLERLAQVNPEHRQTIVDLICGYLRLRKDVPDIDTGSAYSEQLSDLVDPLWIPGREESEVRATAQEILRAHLGVPRHDLSMGVEREPWLNLRLDLHGAKLENFSLDKGQVGDVDFRDAEFWGMADFGAAHFGGSTHFEGAIFRGEADFGSATFVEHPYFSKTQFCERADFFNAKFGVGASFGHSEFWGSLLLGSIRAASDVEFHESEFLGPVYVQHAQFGNAILFESCVFHHNVLMHDIRAQDGMIRLNWSTFYDYVDFGKDGRLFELHGAKVHKETRVKGITPRGWIRSTEEPGEFATYWPKEAQTNKEPDTA